ncbi:MAG: hypothetical protein Q9177_004800 [Variospora cf. flavescens]
MTEESYNGQRLSYSGSLCTVRYVGAVDGTQGSWLGVEWDDPSRGKHDGTHNGKRYFECVSKEPTAASFVRLSKPFDKSVGFLSAMRIKYGSENDVQAGQTFNAIRIGGKDVDEVGFSLIAQKQSAWSNLKVISLNGLCLNGISSQPLQLASRRNAVTEVTGLGLRCEELDLSRNLLENWYDVVAICSALSKLQILKLNGNRLRDVFANVAELEAPLVKLQSLSLANMALHWDQALILCTQERFPMLQTLSLAFNPLGTPTKVLFTLSISSLTRLDLTSCGITSLDQIMFISQGPNLTTLILRSNPLQTLSTTAGLKFTNLRTLDLTSTLLPSLSSLSPIPTLFPLLESLQTSQTPLSTSHPESRLLTIAQLPQLTTLNHTPIPAHERLNSELYYLNLITNLLLSASTPAQEHQIIHIDHSQYQYLCSKHGEPASIQERNHNRARQSTAHISSTDPQQSQQQREDNKEDRSPPRMSLAAHLCTFTLHLNHHNNNNKNTTTTTHAQTQTLTLPLPTTISVYALKGVVGRLFRIAPMRVRLVLETDEWDPVPAAKPADGDWGCGSEDEGPSSSSFYSSVESQEDDDGHGHGTSGNKPQEEQNRKKKKKKKLLWVRREVEISDSVRRVEDWVEGRKEARVRVEERALRGGNEEDEKGEVWAWEEPVR